jgi:hypothetical protein
MTKEEVLKSKEKSVFIITDDGILHEDHPIRKTDSVIVDSVIFNKHIEQYDFFNNSVKIGQFFLYEKLLDGGFRSNFPHNHQLFYPKLGIYLNDLPCDQTIESEWVDCRRTWEWNVEYDVDYVNSKGLIKEYKLKMGNLPTEIQRLPLWDDTLLVYGVWDKIPTWKELRRAYENTWWYHKEKHELRDLLIKNILK